MVSSPSTKRLLDVLEFLVDESVGVVHFVQELRMEAGAPDFFHFVAQSCNTAAFSAHENSRLTGGASVTRQGAMVKAIGEAVERYCSALYDPSELPLASYEGAPFRCVEPKEFALYSPTQYSSDDFPFVPFHTSIPVRWTPAIDCISETSCYIPAAFVYVPYRADQEQGERRIAQSISTGLACHCSWEEAAISAMCEVVERDAFTITWQAQLPMPQIRTASLSESNKDLVSRFEYTGSTVSLFHLAMDHRIPTIMAVLHSTARETPALVFSAACHPDPEQAIAKSLEELALTRGFARHLMTSRPPFFAARRYTNVITRDDHVHLYCDHRNRRHADFLFATKRHIDADEIDNLATGHPKRDLAEIIEQVKSVGHRVLFCDLTSPDIKDIGLAVVRAVIPGFHRLTFGHSLRALGGIRLWEVPRKLGYRSITPTSGDNPAPHPFP